MATVKSTPTANSITVSGRTQKSGTISWSAPIVPGGATISSCVLTGTATASMSSGSATITVDGETVTSGIQFTVNLGTSNTITSVATTAKGGNNKAAGTVTFSDLVYTVTYEEAAVTYTVTFVDWDGAVLKTESVAEGSSATAPTDPTREGYTFTGWDVDFSYVTSNLTVTAQYIAGEPAVSGENVFPKFNGSAWTIGSISLIQVLSRSDYDIEAEFSTDAYHISTSLENYKGKTIRIGAEYIESGGFIRIETSTDILAALNLNALEKTIQLPESETCYISIGIEDRNSETQVRIRGAYMYTYTEEQPDENIPIESISFDKENDAVVSEDGGSITYKLNYNLVPLNATDDVTITIRDAVSTLSLNRTVVNESTIATYNESTDEITFHNNGEVIVTVASNENPDISASMTLSASGITNSGITIAKYKFNKEIDTLPTFDGDFAYTYSDVNNGDGTITRTIVSDFLPSSVSFDGCVGLLEVYNLNLGNSTILDYLFDGCYNLTYIDSSEIKSNAEIMSLSHAFYNCEKLAGELDLSKLNVKIITAFNNAFENCSSLTSINLNGWNTSETYSMNSTFKNCSKLETLFFDGWDFTNVMSVSEMFSGTDILSTISMQNSAAISISNFIYFALPSKENTGNVLNVCGIDDLDSLTSSGAVSYAESKNWTVISEEVPIQSISFGKESDTVVSEDGGPAVYKLNYSLEPAGAVKDITITITDIVSTMSLARTVVNESTIATYNESTDEITFTDNGEVLITATSNQDPAISASMTLSASGIAPRNVFPKFTENEWETDDNITINEQSDYSVTMTSRRIYAGFYLPVPTNWYGKKVTLGCSSIDSTGHFYIVTDDTAWNKLLTLNSTTLEQTIVIPEDEDNLLLFFESKNRGTMSVSDLYAYVGNVEDISLSSISLVESVQVKIDRTVKLTCILEPSDANVYDILWSSDSSNVSLQSNGASCTVSGVSEGTAIVTAVDSVTGLSTSCTVTIIEKDPNLFPPFTQYPWILDDGCTLVSQSDYAISLTATESFVGPILDIPESWYGKTITFSCTEMTSNAAFYISTYPGWDTVTAIDYKNKIVTVTLPSEPMKFCFQCTNERTSGGAFSTSGLYITSDEIEQDDYLINFMPPFTSSLWIISDGATVLTKEDYNCSLNVTTAWAGYAAKVPSSWYGKTIEIGCESLVGTGALISVQDDSGELLGQLNPSNLKRTIDMPESGEYYIYFQSLTTEEISVTGLYADQVILDGNNMFPIFTDSRWVLDTRATLINAGLYDYSFTTAETVGWIGVQIAVPEEWIGKAMRLRIGTITDNASLVVEKTTTFEDLLILNSANPEGVVKILPNEQYTLFFRTDLNGSGEVSVTGAYANVEYELVNVESMSLSETNIEIQTYTDTAIECILSPADASCYNLVWELDNDNIVLTPNDLTCNLLAIAEGSSVLTVTDIISGATASCNITIVDGGDVNIFPPFTTAGWYLSATATLISAENYSYSFETPATWNGVSINIPDIWYGKTIEISYETISDNGALHVQETDGWSIIGELNPSVNKIIMNIPAKGTFGNIVMALQAPSTPGTVSITGASARVITITDDDIEDETNFTCVEYQNRIVGYKKPEPEEVVADAVICCTTGQVLNALANATAGQTIYLKEGIYSFPTLLEIGVQGTFDNYISIKGYPGDTVIISNTMVAFLGTAKYINFENIKIMDLVDLNWSYALEVYGGASYINFRNIRISNIKCAAFDSAAGETNGCNPFVVYGNSTTPITNVLIENCYIHDCDTGWSEGLTFNGNVDNCIIRNCTINNITNIGIDFAGNYSWTGTVGDDTNQTRNCIVENTLVMNCQSPVATSAGLYSDGARDCTFRYNIVYNAQCGIELGGEQSGAVSQNFYVHNNLIIDSGRSIGVGGYQETSAEHKNAYIYNNTFVCGDNNNENYGLYVERASNVNFYNNIVYGTENTTLFSNWYNSEVNVGNNCWYQPNGEKPSVDTTGIFADPLFVNNDLTINGRYQLSEISPCFNAGTVDVSNDYIGETDLNGNQRIFYDIVDIGAFENNVAVLEKTIVAEYTFTSSTDTLPVFNNGFTYTYEDIDNEDGTITRTIFSYYVPTEISFENCEELLEVLSLNISELTSLEAIFNNCLSLTYINCMDWDTSQITNMSNAFHDCQSLTSLDIFNWDTSNVTNMNNIFQNCTSLTSIDVDNWDTSKVENMRCMFGGCANLFALNLNNFKTNLATDMGYMFTNCYNLTSLNISNWNTSNVTNMEYMFTDCQLLTSLDINNFDTNQVTNMYCMFAGCTNLISLDISNFDTSNVDNKEDMFEDTTNLEILKLTNASNNTLTALVEVVPTVTRGKLYAKNISSENTIAYAAKGWYVIKNLLLHLQNDKINNTLVGNKKVLRIHIGNHAIYDNTKK